jgi:hypothetical protein
MEIVYHAMIIIKHAQVSCHVNDQMEVRPPNPTARRNVLDIRTSLNTHTTLPRYASVKKTLDTI